MFDHLDLIRALLGILRELLGMLRDRRRGGRVRQRGVISVVVPGRHDQAAFVVMLRMGSISSLSIWAKASTIM